MSGANGDGVRPELPDGWEWRRLADLGTWVGGGTPSKQRSEYWEGGTVPWVSPKDMKVWRLKTTRDAITEAALEGSAAKRFPAGSVALVARSGILEHTLPISLVPFAATANQDMRVVVPDETIDAEWLLYALQSEAEAIRRSCQKDGTTVASLDVRRLVEWPLAVPPPVEQQGIVRTVRRCFDRIDEAEQPLRAAKERVEAFRAAILQRALEAGEAQPLDNLLEGIEAGRSFRCHGHPAPDDKWGVVKVSAMTWGDFREEENKEVIDESVVDERWEIRSGDVLISRANTSEYVGAAVLVRETRAKLLLSDKSLRLLLRSEEVSAEWLSYALNAPASRKQMSTAATGTSDSMRNLSQDKIRALKLRVPPLAVQEDLARQIEVEMAAASQLQGVIAMQLKGSDSLRKAVLRDALDGSLAVADAKDAA